MPRIKIQKKPFWNGETIYKFLDFWFPLTLILWIFVSLAIYCVFISFCPPFFFVFFFICCWLFCFHVFCRACAIPSIHEFFFGFWLYHISHYHIFHYHIILYIIYYYIISLLLLYYIFIISYLSYCIIYIVLFIISFVIISYLSYCIFISLGC